MEDDWHFKLNGDEYAIAEVGAKQRSTPSDEGIGDLAYAFSGLPQEEVRRKSRQADCPSSRE